MSDEYLPTMEQEWLEAQAEAEYEQEMSDEHSREAG